MDTRLVLGLKAFIVCGEPFAIQELRSYVKKIVGNPSSEELDARLEREGEDGLAGEY